MVILAAISIKSSVGSLGLKHKMSGIDALCYLDWSLFVRLAAQIGPVSSRQFACASTGMYDGILSMHKELLWKITTWSLRNLTCRYRYYFLYRFGRLQEMERYMQQVTEEAQGVINEKVYCGCCNTMVVMAGGTAPVQPREADEGPACKDCGHRSCSHCRAEAIHPVPECDCDFADYVCLCCGPAIGRKAQPALLAATKTGSQELYID